MVDERHLERLDDFLEERGFEAVWLGKPNSFAWLTRGDNIVDEGAEIGVAAAGYDGNSVRVITANNEADRMRSEELPAEVSVESFDWYDQSLGEAIADRTPNPSAADFPVPGLEHIDISTLRNPLTPNDVDRYRTISAQGAEAVEEICHVVEPETTEREAAALLHRELVDRGFHVPCVLVGGSERAQHHRHFTPQSTPLGGFGIFTAGVAKSGLYDSITRIVAFDSPEWLTDRHEAVSRVHATALVESQRAGENSGTAKDVFTSIVDAYESLGFPGEWENHHQGGAAGFAMREWIASPTATDPIEFPMAFAWNPTVAGAKNEDTVLVSKDDIEVLTRTGSWPTSEYHPPGGGQSVELHDVLYC